MLNNLYEWLAGIITDFGPEDALVSGVGILALLFARRHAVELANAYGGERQYDNIPIHTFAPALPFVLVSLGHRLIRAISVGLNLFFGLSILASWSLPWTFSTLVRLVYERNGLAHVYDGSVLAGRVQDFAGGFLPLAIAQAAILLPYGTLLWLQKTRRAQGGLLSHWSLQAFLSVALIAILVWTAVYVLPYAMELSEILLGASAGRGDLNSVASQFLLGPFYAQALLAGLGGAYVVVSLLVVAFTGLEEVTGLRPNKFGVPKAFLPRAQSRVGVFRTLFIGIGGGASISFAVTLLALMLGRELQASAQTAAIPAMPRLLFVNAVFDGLTLMVTAYLLGQLLKRTGKHIRGFLTHVGTQGATGHSGPRFPPGRTLGDVLHLLGIITLDILLAALFAVAAIYFSLLGTDWAVTPRQAARVLFAIAPDGSDLSIGERFWVMHTTFIPTLICLVLLLYGIVFTLFWLPVWGVLSGFAGLWRGKPKAARQPGKGKDIAAALQWLTVVVAPQIVSEGIDRTVKPPIERMIASGRYVASVNDIVRALPDRKMTARR